MNFWNEIINTAMLGTDKKKPEPALLPAGIAALIPALQEQTTDKEEQFLQTASLVLNYRHCGFTAMHKEGIDLPKAPPEEKPYCSNFSLQVLKDILELENDNLLTMWLQLCHKKQQVVQPAIIPALLQLAKQHKKLRTTIISCCGNKGQWLSRFNTDWNFTESTTDEEIWQTGALEQRKQVLASLRTTNPAQALEWIQQTWQQEDANTKHSLLQILEINISSSDNTFLESLSGEKSKKVKEQAVHLLKKIPGSNIVQQYAAIIKETVQPQKAKALLGLSNKTSLKIQLPVMDETVFKTGIEKLSNNKELSDDEYIAYQLMQNVPLSFYEEWWQLKPEEIINLFQKDAVGTKLFGALVTACVNFIDYRWAIFLMQFSSVFYLDLLPLLPLQQKEYYSNKFFPQQPDNIIFYAINREEEWSLELTKNIFKYTAKNPYQYTRSFYNQHIHLIPGKIASELEKCTPSEENLQAGWSTTCDYILKLLQLKAQVNQSFAAGS